MKSKGQILLSSQIKLKSNEQRQEGRNSHRGRRKKQEISILQGEEKAILWRMINFIINLKVQEEEYQ